MRCGGFPSPSNALACGMAGGGLRRVGGPSIETPETLKPARVTWREALRSLPPGFAREAPWVPARGTGATMSVGLEGCMSSGDCATISLRSLARGRSPRTTTNRRDGEWRGTARRPAWASMLGSLWTSARLLPFAAVTAPKRWRTPHASPALPDARRRPCQGMARYSAVASPRGQWRLGRRLALTLALVRMPIDPPCRSPSVRYTSRWRSLAAVPGRVPRSSDSATEER